MLKFHLVDLLLIYINLKPCIASTIQGARNIGLRSTALLISLNGVPWQNFSKSTVAHVKKKVGHVYITTPLLTVICHLFGMDDIISAESWHIFNFCTLKLWSYCTDLHQNFTRCTGISAAINPFIYKTRISKCQRAKNEDGQFWRLQKGAKVNRLP